MEGDATTPSVYVYSNHIHGNCAQGVLIENGGVGSPTYVKVDNNYIYSNGQEGVLIRDSGTHHNTVTANWIGFYYNTAATDLTLRPTGTAVWRSPTERNTTTSITTSLPITSIKISLSPEAERIITRLDTTRFWAEHLRARRLVTTTRA
ncbi:MAG: right-handed parallel beta-helix repeat-containing protein [Candidatus Verstraetearchaeota archaeon]|nr:right-handed parallel beta-helix repeat-containing protein [Candidatus Verstraetearchaeota archaeon]